MTSRKRPRPPALLYEARAAMLRPRRTYDVLGPLRSSSEVVHRFNPSLIRFADRWLIAYRIGRTQSRLALAELDDEFQWRSESLLQLPSLPESRDGQEDPGLFRFRDELWLSYTGHERPLNTMLLAKITPEGDVLEHLAPELVNRQPREKNWVFFDSEGELHAVYHGAPHRVLRVTGSNAELLPHQSRHFVLPTAFPWPYGDVRGGAPPVLVNGEWYHFFHTQVQQEPAKHLYCLSLYAFSAAPPFGITRLVRAPLYAPVGVCPDTKTPYVVFPAGAVLDDDRWLISVGEWDASCRVLEFARSEVESRLGEA